MRYRYENGEYVLFDDRPEIKTSGEARMKEVAILYSVTGQGTVVHAHGNAEFIQSRHDALQHQYKQTLLQAMGSNRPDVVASCENIMASLQVHRSRTIPCSELNQCIENADYLGRFLTQSREQQVGVCL